VVPGRTWAAVGDDVRSWLVLNWIRIRNAPWTLWFKGHEVF
jgi:hypothetical protein